MATDTAAPPTPAQYEEFLAWQRAEDARKKVADAGKLSFRDVMHRLVDNAEWHHTGERIAAHAAIADEYPDESTPDTEGTESNGTPVPYVAPR